jgi:tRNA (adenine22-N1)-methyltransferase
MNLEPRLLAVASEIKSHTHADIGSDHARLPRYLLETGRIRKAIIVEKNLVPFENATKTLAGLQAKIYLGNGVEPLNEPIHSLSITGMGAKLMVSILEAHPDKLPDPTIMPNLCEDGV